MSEREALLTLIVSPGIEEFVVDWLLQRNSRGFTSFPCHGHGSGGHELTPAEQVDGRKREVGFWIVLPEDEAQALARRLVAEFGALRAWITPVIPLGDGRQP